MPPLPVFWRCGREETSRPEICTRELDCLKCRVLKATYAPYPDRLILADSLNLDPHSRKSKADVWCGVLGHPVSPACYEDILKWSFCTLCAKSDRYEPDRMPTGTVYSAPKTYPGSSLEDRFFRYLKNEYADLGVHGTTDNAVIAIEGNFFGYPWVAPDIIIEEPKIAVEIDSPGPVFEWHTGDSESKDVLKDTLLRGMGWKVVRVRCDGLPPLASANANVRVPSSLYIQPAAFDQLSAAIDSLQHQLF